MPTPGPPCSLTTWETSVVARPAVKMKSMRSSPSEGGGTGFGVPGVHVMPGSATGSGCACRKLSRRPASASSFVVGHTTAYGTVVEWVRLDGPVSELFDVAFLDDVKCPMALGQQSPENLSLVSIEGGRG
jgi:hypothetical protein